MASLIVAFEGLGADSLPIAGGKAANLGEMVRAGFPVPAGFCITTAAFRRVADDAEDLDTTAQTYDYNDTGDIDRPFGEIT